jgi:hypothetical protein
MTINAIFDVERGIPINYACGNRNSDKLLLYDQMSSLYKNDILICDAGYASREMFFKCDENVIDCIVNLPKSWNIVKNIKSKREKDIDVEIKEKKETLKIRLIKYKIKSNKGDRNIYLGTTLVDRKKYPMQFLIDAYKKRWDIETHFRYAKKDLSLADIKSQSLDVCKQDVMMHQFINIINSYIEYLLGDKYEKTAKNGTYKIRLSTSNALDDVINVIEKMLYKSSSELSSIESKRDFNIQLNLHLEDLTYYKPKRKAKRVSKKPQRKWTISGGSSGRPNNTNNDINDKKKKKKKVKIKKKIKKKIK